MGPERVEGHGRGLREKLWLLEAFDRGVTRGCVEADYGHQEGEEVGNRITRSQFSCGLDWLVAEGGQ